MGGGEGVAAGCEGGCGSDAMLGVGLGAEAGVGAGLFAAGGAEAGDGAVAGEAAVAGAGGDGCEGRGAGVRPVMRTSSVVPFGIAGSVDLTRAAGIPGAGVGLGGAISAAAVAT